jgi:hypothetical protein
VGEILFNPTGDQVIAKTPDVVLLYFVKKIALQT